MEKHRRMLNIIILIVVGLALISFFIFKTVYFQNIMQEEGLDSREVKIYKYHFEMIVDNPESTFWKAVYASACEIAEEKNVLLEMTGTNWDNTYNKLDYMNMGIASQVDGIIVEYNGEEELEEKIDIAVTQGIPVITVMGDATASKRQSFVGVNDYQMGVTYGAEVAKYVDESTESIVILKKTNLRDTKQNQLFTQIGNAAKEAVPDPGKLKVEGKTLLASGTFDIEESIRNIFQQAGGPPDIMVCMDEETTECAYQAMIDYNMAGKVKIIGYYISETVMEAVEKGLILSTCAIDTESIGKYSIEALSEYLEEGRVNNYYSVDLAFVTSDSMLNQERSPYEVEEIQMEKSVAVQ